MNAQALDLLDVLESMANRVQENVRATHESHGRGLVLIQLRDWELLRSGFTPVEFVTVPYVMDLGLSETEALSVIDLVRSYDMATEAVVLLTEDRFMVVTISLDEEFSAQAVRDRAQRRN